MLGRGDHRDKPSVPIRPSFRVDATCGVRRFSKGSASSTTRLCPFGVEPCLIRRWNGLSTYRLSAAYDCWGIRRSLRRGSRNGLWFLDATCLGEPVTVRDADADAEVDRAAARPQRLAALQMSGQFSQTEIATLHALVIERLTIAEIAERDGCSRQR